MPYTKSELGTVRFYQDFVSDLRNKYFGEIKRPQPPWPRGAGD